MRKRDGEVVFPFESGAGPAAEHHSFLRVAEFVDAPGQGPGITWHDGMTAVAFPQDAGDLPFGTPDAQGRTARGGDAIAFTGYDRALVCRPEEALDCFLRTKIDVLVLGNYFVTRD